MYIAGDEAVFRRYKAVIMFFKRQNGEEMPVLEMHAEAREACYLDSELVIYMQNETTSFFRWQKHEMSLFFRW